MTKPISEFLLTSSDLLFGDVILCHEPSEYRDVYEETGSVYSHAAFYMDGNIIGVDDTGFKESDVESFLSEYAHFAVLRNSLESYWTANRVERLQDFVQAVSSSHIYFNTVGMYRVPDRKEQSYEGIPKKLEAYFKNRYKVKPIFQESYFCSEFLVCCFAEAGFFSEAMLIVIDPKTIAPGDLAKYPDFGEFAGYIFNSEDYLVPYEDDFRLIAYE